jgi:uncharacterized protein YdeI (YjbR/CyaY-like superfamily)
MPVDPLPRKTFATAASWRAWLEKHHASAPGVWLQFAKKRSGFRSVTYAEAVQAALCYGWIDGQVQRVDDTHYLQRFTPRKRDSIWSRINREKALALIEGGLMQPAGLAAIEQAKSNGRWDAAYAGPSKAEVPPDFAAALKKHAKAAASFTKLDAQNRYAILFRLHTARSSPARAARAQKFIAMLERGEVIYPKRK